MAMLLKGEAFDRLLLREGMVRTYMEYRFFGKRFSDYYEAGEQEQYQGREFVSWSEAKPFFLELIRGKRTPLAIQLQLQLPKEDTSQLLSDVKRSSGEELPTLLLMLRYENGIARLLTGVSKQAFSLDRSVEEAWDAGARELLRALEIAVEEE